MPKIKYLAVVVVLAITFTKCSVADDKFKIGLSLPLTGEFAEYGIAVKNGFKLAELDHTEEFKQIKLSIEDNQYSAIQAISAFNKLVEIDKIDLLYNWGEAPLSAIAPLAKRNKLPVLALSLDPEPAKDNPYIIRTVNHAELYAIELLKYCRKQGWKKIKIIYTEDPFTLSMIDGLKKNILNEEIDIFQNFSPNEQDFKSTILKLKQEKYDVLGVYLFNGQIQNFYRQASNLNYQIPTFGTDIFESEKEIAAAQGKMDGAIYPNIKIPDAFSKAYLKRFKNSSQMAYAYNAYITAIEIVAAFKKYKLLANQNLVVLLRETKSKQFQISKINKTDYYYEFPLTVKKIKQSQIVDLY